MEEEGPSLAHERALLTPTAPTPPTPPTPPAVDVKRARVLSGVLTVGLCLAYTCVGPLIIMVNKVILTRSGFRYPILLTCFHQVSSGLFSFLLIRVLHVIPLEHRDMPWSFWRQNVLVVGFATTAALCTGNTTYLYLTVSFIEMLKGFTPVVTMMVQTLFGEGMPRPAIACSVLCISIGTAISSFGELHLNWTGISLMLLSIYSEAMRLMLTQRMLQKLHFHVLEGLYYTAPASAIWMLLLALVVELPRLPILHTLSVIREHWCAATMVALASLTYKPESSLDTSLIRRFITFCFAQRPLFMGASCLGFLVNVTSFLVIQRTSVVMLKLLAISRNAMVVFCGIIFFEERVSIVQAVGYLVSLCFFVVYNLLQLRDAGHC